MKVAIFIDGAYFEKILKEHYGEPRVDYNKLSQVLAGAGAGKELLRTYYYDCDPYQSSHPTQQERERFSNKQRFFSYLGYLPRYEVRKGRLQHRGYDNHGKPKFMQKGVDTLLSIDMVSLAATGKMADAILLAGDSDCLPAVKAIKPFGVNIILYHGPTQGTYHIDLWKACDERHPITQELINEVKVAPNN